MASISKNVHSDSYAHGHGAQAFNFSTWEAEAWDASQ